MQHHNDTIINRRRKTSLTKYVPLTSLQGFEKAYLRFACERELETEQKLQYFDPTLMAVSVVSFSFSRAVQPEAQRPTLLGDGFLYWILSASSLDSNSIGDPFGLAWLSWPHLVYNSVRSLTATVLTFALTELYNSSTRTQSPTRSLKSRVWSSSSGNNCHAVHRSLSSGASVYECTMGIFFTSSHFVSQFPPTRFPLITAIRMCHFLPVHHLGMAFLAGSKVKIQHLYWLKSR